MQDRSGQALYRRIINNPVRRDLEVVTDDAERSVARVAWEAGGTFFLLMPDIPQAARLILKTGRAATVPGSTEEADALPALETHEFDLTGMGQEDC